MDFDKAVRAFWEIAQRFKFICPRCSGPKTKYQLVCYACKQERGYE